MKRNIINTIKKNTTYHHNNADEFIGNNNFPVCAFERTVSVTSVQLWISVTGSAFQGHADATGFLQI